MGAIHIEILLPAFVWGCVVDTPCARKELALQRQLSKIRLASRSRLFSLPSVTSLGRSSSKGSGWSGWSSSDAAMDEDPEFGRIDSKTSGADLKTLREAAAQLERAPSNP